MTANATDRFFYGQDPQKFATISREQEQKLARQMKKGDAAARDQLICANVGWAINLAMRFTNGNQNRRLPAEDAISEALVGLIEAVDRFDPRRGFRVTTFASWWIRKCLYDAMYNRSIIHVPKYLQMGDSKEQNPARVKDAVRAYCLASLDYEMTFRRINELQKTDDRLHNLEDREEVDQMNRAMKKLNLRARDILRRRAKGEKLHEIGERYGLSRERIRQIEKQAIERVREELGVECEEGIPCPSP